MSSPRSWAALLLSVVLPVAAARASPEPGVEGASVQVEPKEIHVGMFYRGTKVHVHGTAPAGYRLAIVCLGHESKVELKRKGKVRGVLWMNVGNVTFEHVPSVYLAVTDSQGGPQPRALPADLMLGLGYSGLEAQVLPVKADEDMRKLFHEFIKLKEDEQLYSVKAGPAGAGADRFSADFWLPASVPAGTYEVQVVGYEGESGRLLTSEELTVGRSGLAAVISSMAENHGLVYGVLSVLVAIAMGFLSGMVFRMASKGH